MAACKAANAKAASGLVCAERIAVSRARSGLRTGMGVGIIVGGDSVESGMGVPISREVNVGVSVGIDVGGLMGVNLGASVGDGGRVLVGVGKIGSTLIVIDFSVTVLSIFTSTNILQRPDCWGACQMAAEAVSPLMISPQSSSSVFH
jgi:hypothetical protein